MVAVADHAPRRPWPPRAQWVDEAFSKSSGSLRILQYHGTNRSRWGALAAVTPWLQGGVVRALLFGLPRRRATAFWRSLRVLAAQTLTQVPGA